MAASLTLTGPSPSSGYVAAPSANFTVTISGFTAPTIVTPNDGGYLGTFNPPSLTFSANGSQTFTYTPFLPGIQLGVVTPYQIGITNNQLIPNPATVPFTTNGTVRYVTNATGSNTGAGGTYASPYKIADLTANSGGGYSIPGAACSILTPGDTLYFRGGTYTMTAVSVQAGMFYSQNTIIGPTVSGTAARPITLAACPDDPAGSVIIQWAANQAQALMGTNQNGNPTSYARFIGFTFPPVPLSCIFTVNGTPESAKQLVNNGTSSEFAYCDIQGQDVSSLEGSANVDNNPGLQLVGGTLCWFHNNKVHGFKGLGENQCGIQNYHSDFWIVEDNYIYNCYQAVYDKDPDGSNMPTSYDTYRRNYFTGNVVSTFLGGEFSQSVNYQIYDNFWSGPCLIHTATGIGSKIYNNLFIDTVQTSTAGDIYGGNIQAIQGTTNSGGTADRLMNMWNNIFLSENGVGFLLADTYNPLVKTGASRTIQYSDYNVSDAALGWNYGVGNNKVLNPYATWIGLSQGPSGGVFWDTHSLQSVPDTGTNGLFVDLTNYVLQTGSAHPWASYGVASPTDNTPTTIGPRAMSPVGPNNIMQPNSVANILNTARYGPAALVFGGGGGGLPPGVYYDITFTGTNGQLLNTADPADWPVNTNTCFGGNANIVQDGLGGFYTNLTTSGAQAAQIPGATMPTSWNFQLTFNLLFASSLAGNRAGVTFACVPPYSTGSTNVFNWMVNPANGSCWCVGGLGTSLGFGGSFLPVVGTTYLMKFIVQSASGNTTFSQYYSSDNGANFLQPTLNPFYTIPTPTNPPDVGFFFQNAAVFTQTATTGTHIVGPIELQNLLPPPVTCQIATASIMPSGQSARLSFTKISNGSVVNPQFLNTMPTFLRNGVSIGVNQAESVAWATPFCKYMIIPFVDSSGNPIQIHHADVMTMNTVAGWVTMADAGGSGSTTGQALTNNAPDFTTTPYTYHSANGFDSLPRTFKPGQNIQGAVANGVLIFLFANLRFRQSANEFIHYSTNVTDPNGFGWPIFLTGGNQKSLITNFGAPNQLDARHHPTPPGYYGVGWDDLAFGTANAVTISLIADNSASWQFTQDALCLAVANTGSSVTPGTGQFQLFLLTQLPGSTDSNAQINVNYQTAGGTSPIFQNQDVRFGGTFSGDPTGDFIFPSTQALSWDRTTNPFQLSNSFLRNFPVVTGPLRWVDALLGYEATGDSNLVEPWEMMPSTAFSYNNLLAVPGDHTITLLAAVPVTTSAYPYIYADWTVNGAGGTTWTPMTAGSVAVVLGANCGSTDTVITLSALPVLADQPFDGIMITIGTENMRCRGFNPSTLQATVNRASWYNSLPSTAQSHTAGTAITLGTRLAYGAISKFGGTGTAVLGFTTTAPHGLRSGQAWLFTGSFPKLLLSDGVHNAILASGTPVHLVTGPSSFIMVNTGGAGSTALTFNTTTALSGPTIQYLQSPGISWEQPARISQQMGSDAYYNLPLMASDDFVAQVATVALAAQTNTALNCWFELSDELWNPSNRNYFPNIIISRCNGVGDQNGIWWQAKRQGQIGKIIRSVFGAQASRVKMILANQPTTPPAPILALATTNGDAFQGIARAPYFNADDDPASVAFCNNLIPQTGTTNPNLYGPMIDYLFTSVQFYTGTTGFNLGQIAGVVAAANDPSVATYNTFLATLTAPYPGSVYPPIQNILYEGGFQYGAPLGVSSPLRPGVQQPNTSGQYGDILYNVNYDMIFNPVFGIHLQDIFAALQNGGFTTGCMNGYNSIPAAEDFWGAHYSPIMPDGTGDGSDGKFNNLSVTATPGMPTSFALGSTNYLASGLVSVIGNATNQWLGAQNVVVVPVAPAAVPASFLFGL